MSVKDLYPNLRPSLALNFAQTKTLDPRITFSRASTGTYYDGVTHAKAEENLLTYSQEFDNAAWTESDATVTANDATAPDGTTTADKLTPNASSTVHLVSQSANFISGNSYVVSTFAKAAGYDYVRLFVDSNAFGANTNVFFDLSSGSVATENGNVDSSSIVSVGNGWYRCSMTVTATSSISSVVNIYSVETDNTPSFAGDGTSGSYIWGAQLEQRDSLTAYTATTSQPITNYIPVLQSAAAGEARFDHDPVTGESKGLLIEEQRTNELTYSEEFDNAAVTKEQVTIDANVAIAPDGTLTADKMVSTAVTDHQNLRYSRQNNGESFSIYAKYGGFQYLEFALFANAESHAVFDIQNGSIADEGNLINALIQDVGNGWYRCTVNATGTAYNFWRIGLNTTGSPSGGSNPESVTGDGYSGIFIWGAQLEAGAFPTSYIKTTSAQATRAADVASIPTSAFGYNASEGTLFAEISSYEGNPRLLHLNDGSDSNRAQITAASSSVAAYVQATGDSGSFISVAGAPTVPFEVALGIKTNDMGLTVNGSSVSTDTSQNVPVSITKLNIGSGATGGSIGQAHIKSIKYYPRRLTNAQLQALTEG